MIPSNVRVFVCPEPHRYTQFCELYRTWLKQRGWTMRIDHVAGDKAFGPPPHQRGLAGGALPPIPRRASPRVEGTPDRSAHRAGPQGVPGMAAGRRPPCCRYGSAIRSKIWASITRNALPISVMLWATVRILTNGGRSG